MGSQVIHECNRLPKYNIMNCRNVMYIDTNELSLGNDSCCARTKYNATHTIVPLTSLLVHSAV
jgi:hypothetical protein